MISRAEWDALSEQARWDQYCLLHDETVNRRPQEGNAILRIDLELPAEQIAQITHSGAFRVSVETP